MLSQRCSQIRGLRVYRFQAASPVFGAFRYHSSLGLRAVNVSTSVKSFSLFPTMARRRNHSTEQKEKEKEPQHDYSHSHSLFSHSHSHGENGHNHEAERILAALGGAADRGSRITLIGLFSNIGLTVLKAAAGWFLHSAALLADAGHSLSDLLGDFVVLFCWKLSRKPPSERYPYGLSKYETLGTTTVSLLLIGGSLGIAFHSYHLLLVALSETAANVPGGVLQNILANVTSAAPNVPNMFGGHSHAHGVDPNAAWFAAVSVIVKEWMYRATKRVAQEEHSPVLLANAIHHRSDAYSSVVALVAILGSWIFPAIPLDPLGGLLVAIIILKQGIQLFLGAWDDLVDASVSAKTRQALRKAVTPLVVETTGPLTGIGEIRARRSGSLLHVDLVANVSETLSIAEAVKLEDEIADILRSKRKDVTEVRVKWRCVPAIQ
ncbi:mitochondrial iron ion transporter [Mycena floridula]|nr:mitochondrial iron ion transporter [Mycena floridula]